MRQKLDRCLEADREYISITNFSNGNFSTRRSIREGYAVDEDTTRNKGGSGRKGISHNGICDSIHTTICDAQCVSDRISYNGGC